MNVLFVSAEAVPFAKVGGMADVVGSLPKALRQQQTDTRVIIPGYGFINHYQYDISHLFTFHQPMRTGTAEIRVFSTEQDGVPIYLVQAWPYFGREESVYTTWEWDVPRFIFFNQIVMGVMWELNERFGWMPDTVHVNDWHTGLLPFLIKNTPSDLWQNVGTLLSIHNMAYQGDHVGGFLWEAGVPGRHHPELTQRGLTDNLLAIAIAYSDIVTTVSPRYATEIQYPYMGYGLDDLVRSRAGQVHGILNGIDTEIWNPETDTYILENYTADDFIEARANNKRYLQQHAGLKVDDNILLIGMVSRLVWQKGLDLAAPALRQFLAGHDAQFIVLGSGDPQYEGDLGRITEDFHWKSRAYLHYDAATAQQIYAGSDLFLMPSHFEPCGIGQMIAMRYGALPLVRETGGLADTVENYDDDLADAGTGFVFHWQETGAILGTLRWAHQTYQHRRDTWRRMQHRAMQKDFSWSTSARQYIHLYEKTTKERLQT